jgi:phosphatidate cytidylyltransferase
VKRVLTALVLIPLVLALVFRGPLWAVALVSYFFLVLAVREYLDLVAHYVVQPPRVVIWILVGFVGALTIAASARQAAAPVAVPIILGLVLLAPYAVLVAAFRERTQRDAMISGALSFLVFPWVVVPMLLLILFRAAPHGWFLLLYVLLVVWSGDIFAYYVGRTFGRTRLAPTISPKKSWEGAAASLVGSAFVGAGVTYVAPGIATLVERSTAGHLNEGFGMLPSLPLAAFSAILINAAAQLGDLAESLLKRGAGVKDSGALLPGHGGVLDRIDALLFAAPVAAAMFVIWAWASSV